MRNLAAAAALLALALPVRAQQEKTGIFIEGIDVPVGLKGSVKDFQEAHAPAKIDPKPVDELFDRLSKSFSPSGLTGIFPAARDGSQESVAVQLVEVAGPQPQGDVIDLVMRRYFSHIEARSQAWKELPGGEGQLEVWQFQIGLDGTILAARRQLVVGKVVASAPGVKAIQADPKRSSVSDKRPKDPESVKKWNELAPKLRALRLAQTV